MMEIARGLVTQLIIECPSFLEAKNSLQTNAFQKILFHNQKILNQDYSQNNKTTTTTIFEAILC